MSSDIPRALRVRAAALEVEWPEGAVDAIAFTRLRSRCRCAECRSARQQHDTVATPENVTVLDAIPYGPNAIRIVFSDGHARGIFPFTYLRELAADTSHAG